MACDPDLQIHKISGAVPPLSAPESPPGVPLTPAPGGHLKADDAAEKPRFVEPIFRLPPASYIPVTRYVTIYTDKATGLRQEAAWARLARSAPIEVHSSGWRPAYRLVIRPKQVPA